LSTAPAISIVTPTYNRRAALLRALESVRSQSFTDYEHIVVDDGSTDGTGEAVAALGDPRIVYIALSVRQGANPARNAGIEASRAEIITFLDSDDAFLPHRLAATVSRFRADGTVRLFISSFTTMRGDRESLCANREGFIDADALEKALALQTIFIAGSAITVWRDILLAAGWFDPDMPRFQDRELLLRLSRLSGAHLGQEVDWLKYTSSDSISAQRNGYVEPLVLLAGKHPRLGSHYRYALRYVLARHLFKRATKGEFSMLLADYQTARRAPSLGFSVLELLQSLIIDRKRRKASRAAIRAVPHQAGWGPDKRKRVDRGAQES
jgi:glycosyltransferase involved in cell wall biosynthesis